MKLPMPQNLCLRGFPLAPVRAVRRVEGAARSARRRIPQMTVLTANAPDDRVDRLDLGKVVLLRNADVQDATGHVFGTAERGIRSATNFDKYKTLRKILLGLCV